MSKFWKYKNTWDMIIKTIALFGPGGGVAISAYMEDPFWVGVGLACLALSTMLSIWMVDKDNNGVVDLFEKKKK